MKSVSRFLAAASVLVAFAATPALAANVIVNGDFEAGPLGNVVPGWFIDSAVSPDSIKVLDGNSYIPCCGANGTPTAMANKFVSFGAGNTQNAPSRIAQNFTLSAGMNTLTFDYGAIGVAAHSLTFGIYDYTTETFLLVSNVSANPSANFDTLFQSYSVNFLSGGGLTNLQFVSRDGTVNKDMFLDNVSVAGVPEPAAWALMLAGFGLVGGAMRRRSKVSVTYA